MTDSDIELRIERFRAACRERGVKLTHQRLVVFREVIRSDEHPDVATVYNLVRSQLPTISLDTVYRTLSFLVENGQLKTLGSTHGKVRYDGNIRTHHHFVCTECGRAFDFESEDYDSLEPPDGAGKLGRIDSTHVELRGVCRECGGDPAGES